MNSRQIDQLTATRGFAALLVVIFHFGLEVFPFSISQQFFSRGNLAVSYFFVLSGFIMCWTYKDQHAGYGGYLKRRVARIVPVYLLALIAYILFYTWQHYKHGEPLAAGFATASWLTAGFLQAYFPPYALTVNSPSWSLSVEMLFYLVFPLFLISYRKDIKWFAIVTLLIFIASQAVHIYMVRHLANPSDALHNFVYYYPFFHLNEFLIGMLGCYCFDALDTKIFDCYPVLLLLALVTVTIYAPPILHNGLLAPLVILFIIAVARRRPAFLGLKPLVYLGEISYSIYILQYPVYIYFQKLNDKFIHIGSYAVVFYIYIVLLVSVSALCYRYVEQPLRKKINALGKK